MSIDKGQRGVRRSRSWMFPALVSLAGAVAVGQTPPSADPSPLLDTHHSLWRQPAPESFRVRVETSEGAFVVEAHRDWAPRGVDRFYQLVASGFFDDSRFFRVVPGFIAQFGLPGDPAVNAAWKDRAIADDSAVAGSLAPAAPPSAAGSPPRPGNVRGTLAFAMTGPDTRSTQIYVNLTDNAKLDPQGFVPIGRVVEGMDAVDRLYSGYGEGAGGGMRGGKQGAILTGGNVHLDAAFPKLSRLLRARLLDDPQPQETDCKLPGFRFDDGSSLPELRLHATTLGSPVRDSSGRVRNAVLILHGTGGDGRGFLREQFAGRLFGPGQPLDARTHYIVLPDGIGHGRSSRPSDGLHMRFPKYTYDDMVRAHHEMLTRCLKVDHLRLVMGTSMGGMQTWVWGESYPEFMDALLPLASLPVEIAGRNRMLRKMAIDSITGDPEWKGGEYAGGPGRQQPRGLYGAIEVMIFMTSSPLQWQKEAPTREKAEAFLETLVKRYSTTLDANDLVYQLDASRLYNPYPRLGEIRAPLLAINSADDQVNPPELGILEEAIRHVPKGRFVLLPITAETRGHGTHSLPAIWGRYLEELLASPVVGGDRKNLQAPKGHERLLSGSREMIRGSILETSMKRPLPGALALFSTFAAALAFGPATPLFAATPAEDAAAVAALDTQYQEAVKRNDAATMDRILADDFALVVGSGSTYTKADLLDSARKGDFVYEQQDELPGTQKVRVWGDTAVVTAHLWIKAVRAGQAIDKKLWFSDTYVRTPSGWRYVFGQASLAPPAPAPSAP